MKNIFSNLFGGKPPASTQSLAVKPMGSLRLPGHVASASRLRRRIVDDKPLVGPNGEPLDLAKRGMWVTMVDGSVGVVNQMRVAGGGTEVAVLKCDPNGDTQMRVETKDGEMKVIPDEVWVSDSLVRQSYLEELPHKRVAHMTEGQLHALGYVKGDAR